MMLSSKSSGTVNEKLFVSPRSRVPDTTAIGDESVDRDAPVGDIAAGARVEAWMMKACISKKGTSTKKTLARVRRDLFNLP